MSLFQQCDVSIASFEVLLLDLIAFLSELLLDYFFLPLELLLLILNEKVEAICDHILDVVCCLVKICDHFFILRKVLVRFRFAAQLVDVSCRNGIQDVDLLGTDGIEHLLEFLLACLESFNDLFFISTQKTLAWRLGTLFSTTTAFWSASTSAVAVAIPTSTAAGSSAASGRSPW